jgi:hypothetical protein
VIPRVWLINAILVLCVLFVGGRAYRVWTQEEPVEAMEPSLDLPASAPEKTRTNERGSLRESAYSVIAERTLFKPDRVEFLPVSPEPTAREELPLISGRRLSLYGVIIMGNDRKALIDNPIREPNEPEKKWVRIGEVMGNWTVSAIEPESILLMEGTKNYKIPLYKKESGKSSQSPDKGRSTTSPTVVNTETQKPSSAPKVISSGTGAVEKRETPGAGARKGNEATGETETIITPFGTLTRDKGGE